MTAQEHEMPKDVVPPGNQTGVYYIPISNLPFNVSWQQIKDYVRQVSDVDHVEIFQRSTSGWVRVKGRDNFDAAFGHLNGKEFSGRAIIADGRNGDSPILVRDWKVCKPTGSTSNRASKGGASTTAANAPAAPDFPLYATGGPVSYPGPSTFSSPTSATSSSFSQHDEYSLSMAGSGFLSSADMSFSQALHSGYDSATAMSGEFSLPPPYGETYGKPQAFMAAAYPGDSLDGGAQAMYNTSAAYAVQPPTFSDYYPPTPIKATADLTTQISNMSIGTGGGSSSSSGGGGGGGSGGGVVYTEQRGVHIRGISRRASGDQIRKLLHDVAGPDAALIETIKVPVQDGGGGAPRGHAFVHFRSASLARRLVDRLDGHEFKGRKLQVRLMKEGDAIGGATSPRTCAAAAAAAAAAAVAAPAAAAAAASSSSSSAKHRGSGKHHHQHHHYSGGAGAGGGDRRRAERKERDRPEKSSSSSSSKAAPLVVGTPGTTSKEKRGKKPVIADGSAGRRTSDTR